MATNDVYQQSNDLFIIFQKIDDASSLLTATCDTFIRTLEDIMKLTSNTSPAVSYEMPIPNITAKNNGSKTPRQSITRSISQENR